MKQLISGFALAVGLCMNSSAAIQTQKYKISNDTEYAKIQLVCDAFNITLKSKQAVTLTEHQTEVLNKSVRKKNAIHVFLFKKHYDTRSFAHVAFDSNAFEQAGFYTFSSTWMPELRLDIHFKDASGHRQQKTHIKSLQHQEL